ncbi:MAG: elongation factor G [Dehalococcoidia bacterium]|nr:elongation factor G [Dehalococcoidia bacterium]
MRAYTSQQLRNVVLMGHSGAGKTALAEAMLFASGATSRMGRVEDHNTVSDFDEQEHAQSHSVSTSTLPIEWSDVRVNLLDTPGYPDFLGEVVAGVTAADAALIAVDAAGGVQAGTETAWELASEAGLPRLFLVTRLDRENTSFQDVLEALRARFGNRVVPLAIPVGSAHDISGTIDLLSGELRGKDGSSGAASPDLASAVSAARDTLAESVAETDDALLNKYLEGEAISDDELAQALHDAFARGEVAPVLPVAALSMVGVRPLLDDIARIFPAPVGRELALEGGKVALCEGNMPLVVRVFKTTADPFVGRLTYMKVLSGTLTADAHPHNVQHNVAERLGHLYLQRGKEQIEVPQLVAGDIGVAAKLQATLTGDTLVTSPAQAVKALPLPFPSPTYRSAIHPRGKADVDKLSSALARLMEQDPTIRVERDPDTAELILTTVGEAQAHVVAARLEKNYGVGVDITVPRVPYRETVTTAAKSEFKHKKQTGGHGQYGHVVIEIEPAARGTGFQFADRVVGGTVPKNFIPAVEKGVVENLPTGPLSKSPIVDLRVTLLDGSYHAVDSSEMAFKIAAAQALHQGVLSARPVLLEPVMKLHIRVPSSYVGDVMNDLSGRRGHVHGVNPMGDVSEIDAEAPLAEVQRYATDLRAISHGRGRFSIEFDRYVETPPNVQDQVLKSLAAIQ